MPDIPQLTKMLQGSSPNTRQKACEELQVWQQPLPQEAIDALHVATDDSDPHVADAAKRALALHPETKDKNHSRLMDTSTSQQQLTNPKVIQTGAGVGGVSFLLLFFQLFSGYGIPIDFRGLVICVLLGAALGIPGAVVGEQIGKSLVAAFFGSLIGIGGVLACFWYLFVLQCSFGC
jgi:hypothetical protein